MTPTQRSTIRQDQPSFSKPANGIRHKQIDCSNEVRPAIRLTYEEWQWNGLAIVVGAGVDHPIFLATPHPTAKTAGTRASADLR